MNKNELFVFGGPLLLALGLLGLFAGDALATAEDSVSNFFRNKWAMGGIALTGAVLLAFSHKAVRRQFS